MSTVWGAEACILHGLKMEGMPQKQQTVIDL